MSIPFPEDTRGNIEQLIANRAPQWGILYQCGISAEGMPQTYSYRST